MTSEARALELKYLRMVCVILDNCLGKYDNMALQ
jgi:hypothetical protein